MVACQWNCGSRSVYRTRICAIAPTIDRYPAVPPQRETATIASHDTERRSYQIISLRTSRAGRGRITVRCGVSVVRKYQDNVG